MRRSLLVTLSFVIGRLLCAQQTVAPTPETTETNRGENAHGYNFQQAFETGYRFATIGGNVGKYRSDVNFGNGIRLLSSDFRAYSRDGHGQYFDEIVLRTQGLGNDPYQSTTLRIRKNSLYEYDFSYRLNNYFNPGLTIAEGLHTFNTQYRWQDHNIVLLPRSTFRLLGGYSHYATSGPALSTISFDDAFSLFRDVRWQQDEYRLGAEAQLFGLKLSVLHAWEFFKDDTTDQRNTLDPGLDTTDRATLSSFNRAAPYHGSTPSWRVGLFSEQRGWLTVNGRFTYSGGRRNFIQDETALGSGRFSALNRQVLVFGSGTRPVTTANLNLTALATDRLTITNHSAYSQIRMNGDNFYREFNNQTLDTALRNFQFLGIRLFSNTTDLQYRLSKWVSVSGGYHIAARRIQSLEGTADADFTGAEEAQQSNILHAGRLGLNLRPWKPLTVKLEAEVGRSNRPIYPTSDKDYHAFGARAQYTRKGLQLSAQARTNYNFNSVSLSSYSSRSRQYGGDAVYSARSWLAFDASYSKLHLDTVGGLAYFVDSGLVTGDRSFYVTNLHVLNTGVRFAVPKKVDVYLGYVRSQDTGDGRGAPLGAGIFASLPAFQLAQTFPLTYESPLARISVPLRPKLRLNFGYQHYQYREEFFTRQDYRAHTGYSSLTFSF